MGFFDLFKKKQEIDIMDKPVDLEFTRSANDLSEAQYIDDPAEKVIFLRDCENRYLVEGNTVDLHFAYNELIKVYYRQRDNWKHALDNCIECCIKDIEMFPKFKEASIEKDIAMLEEVQEISKWRGDKERYLEDEKEINEYEWKIPNVPSFKRLAIIYEKQGKIEEAIQICEKAINYKLQAFEGRLEKLLKKSGIKNRESFLTKETDTPIGRLRKKRLPIDVEVRWREDTSKDSLEEMSKKYKL